MSHYRELFPEISGDGPNKMSDAWWVKYGIEAVLNNARHADEDDLSNMPAHDRVAKLLRGEVVDESLLIVCLECGEAFSDEGAAWFMKEHENNDHPDEDVTYSILPESEAM